MANAKCHFVIDQQLITSITRNRYCLIVVKKHDMLMLGTSIQTACSKCAPAAFITHLEPFEEGQYCSINRALRQVSPNHLQKSSSWSTMVHV